MGIYMLTPYPHSRSDDFSRLKRALLSFLLIILLTACQPSPTPIPDRALETPHLAWTQEVGGPINHPPLRVGDLLIVSPVQQPLVALEVETGAIRWRFDPGVTIWDRAYATDGERVFVGIEGGQLIALDAATGKRLWQADLGINAQVPPLVSGGVLYAATTFAGPGMIGDPTRKAKLFALSPEDGHLLWAFESDNYILQTPFRYGDALYLAGSFDSPEEVDEGGHMRLYALHAADGAVRWQYESVDGFTKQVYATETTVTYIAYQDFTTGVDAATGEMRWRLDTGNWVPTLSGAGNTIYYGSANTVVHAIHADTGEVVWQFNIPEGTFNYILGAPVRVADDLIFLTQQGEVFALNALTGEPRWQFSTGVVGARTGLTVSGGWLFIGDAEGKVYGYTDIEQK